MPCEEFREALSGAAAGGEQELSREVRAHLDACRECCAAFQEEQQLFAAIDSGVRQIANAEVPISLLPRVREYLDRGASPRRSFLPYFVFAGAAICAVLLAVAVRGWRRTNIEPRLIIETSRATSVAKPSEDVVAHNVKPKVRPALRRSRNQFVTERASQPQFTVLLPVGQKQAVDKLLGELRSGAIKPNDVIVEKAEAPSPDILFAPLAISPLEVKPLATIVEDEAPASEKTKS